MTKFNRLNVVKNIRVICFARVKHRNQKFNLIQLINIRNAMSVRSTDSVEGLRTIAPHDSFGFLLSSSKRSSPRDEFLLIEKIRKYLIGC